MSGFIFKQDLAGRYFPGYDKEVSRRLFARELHTNSALMADLQAAHYVKSQKRLTPLQVQISAATSASRKCPLSSCPLSSDDIAILIFVPWQNL